VSGSAAFAVSFADRRWRSMRTIVLAISLALSVVFAACYARSYAAAHSALRAHEARLRQGAECLRYYRSAPDSCLAILYPLPIRDRARVMEVLRLGLFAPAEGPAPLASYTVASDGTARSRLGME